LADKQKEFQEVWNNVFQQYFTQTLHILFHPRFMTTILA
jgi:hypothetical protein